MNFYGDSRYDAIVIGSGLGGLSCALHLARQGYKVLTLEKQPKVGGYAQNFKRGAYNFDVSLHIVPSLGDGQGLLHLFNDLQVDQRINIIKHDPMYCSTFTDRDYVLPGTLSEATAYLQDSFPSERTAISQLVDIYQQIVSTNFDLFWGNPVDVTTYFPSRYFKKSYSQLIQGCTSNAKLQGLLGQFWQSTGLPNDRLAANWGAEVMGSHLLYGNYYIEGGGGALTQIFANTLEEAGCPVLTGSLVTGIIVENRHAVGVRLADGRQFSAPIIISNANPLQTYRELLPQGQIAEPYLNKIYKLEQSCSLLTMYIGLDCPAKNVGINHCSQFFNNNYDNNKSYQLAMAEKYDQTDFVVSDYTNDSSHNHPAGHGIIEMLEAAPGLPWTSLSQEAYRSKKAQVKEIMLKKLAARFPAIRDHIVVCELATPRTLSLATRNPLGSVYGFAQTPEQADVFRFSNVSIIKGLYFAGAWGRGGGGGYMGSIVNGRVTAREIMQREGLHGSPKNFTLYQKQEPLFSPLTNNEKEDASTYTIVNEDLAANGTLRAEAMLKIFRQLNRANDKEIIQMTMMAVPELSLTVGVAINAQLKFQKNSNGKDLINMNLTCQDGRKIGHLNAICWH